MDFDDFELRIVRDGRRYRARVLSPDSTAPLQFRRPFATDRLAQLTQRIAVSGLDDRDGRQAAEELGGKLFETVFHREILVRFRESLARAGSAERGLRICLHLEEAGDLAGIPWECLYDRTHQRFLALDPRTPILRAPEHPEAGRPLAASLPLHVLVVIAEPRSPHPLDTDSEWQQIEQALEPLVKRGEIHLERLERATFEALTERLRRKPFQILHFVGHGQVDERTGEGALLFEDARRGPRPIDGSLLSMVLLSAEQLRLVVLSACSGAAAPAGNRLPSVAQSLMQQRVPAVLALQFEVPDGVAIQLSASLYHGLAEGRPLEEALCQARREIASAGYATQWGNPVLYLRSRDGHIFEIDKPAAPSVPKIIRDAIPQPFAALPRTPARRNRTLFAVAASIAALLIAALGWLHATNTDLRAAAALGRSWRGDNRACPSPPGFDFAFVQVPAGNYSVGTDEGGRPNERPQHKVRIDRPYCLGAFEVTCEQWNQVMAQTTKKCLSERGNLPVSGISWNDARKFASALQIRDPSGHYRLPGEVELEIAARTGKPDDVPFDPSDLPKYANCHFNGGSGELAPIGRYRPNRWGFFDLLGNAWEWADDSYAPYPGGPPFTAKSEPVPGVEKVRRGGSYEDRPVMCRPAYRDSSKASSTYSSFGLRIARDPIPELPARN